MRSFSHLFSRLHGKRVLISVKEAALQEALQRALSEAGLEVRAAKDETETLSLFRESRPHLLLLEADFSESPESGSEERKASLPAILLTEKPTIPVLLISEPSLARNIRADIRAVIYDILLKPVSIGQLLLSVALAVEVSDLLGKRQSLRRDSGKKTQLIGETPVIQALKSELAKVAQTEARVLLSGPAGSGKTLAACYLHEHSQRFSLPFITFHGPFTDENACEAALFGKEDVSGKILQTGALENAGKGTLLLKEVQKIPLKVQAKLLTALQEHKFRRVGGTEYLKTDFRLLTASSVDLLTEIREKRFHADLYYRLAVISLFMPPLSERIKDIPLLADYFLKGFSRFTGVPLRPLGKEIGMVLQSYHWPLNVEQLKNVMLWLFMTATRSPQEPLLPEALPPYLKASVPQIPLSDKDGPYILELPLKEARELFEGRYLQAQLTRFGGNISQTAQFIGMERSALHRKLKHLNLNRGRPDNFCPIESKEVSEAEEGFLQKIPETA